MKREENSDMMGVGIGQARLRVNKGRRDFFFALGWKKTLLDSFSHPQNIIFP